MKMFTRINKTITNSLEKKIILLSCIFRTTFTLKKKKLCIKKIHTNNSVKKFVKNRDIKHMV